MSEGKKTRRLGIEKEAVLEKVASLARRCQPRYAIAEQIGISMQQVDVCIAEIKKRRAARTMDSREEQIKEEVEVYQEIMREAWVAYQEGRGLAKKTTTKSVPKRRCAQCFGERKITDPETRRRVECPACAGTGFRGGVIERQLQLERRLPAGEYLKIVKECQDAIRELLGHDAPKETRVQATVLNWDVLLLKPPDAGTPVPPVAVEVADEMAIPVLKALVRPPEDALAAKLSELPPACKSAVKLVPSPSTNGDGKHG